MSEIQWSKAKELINLFKKSDSDEGSKISQKESLEIYHFMLSQADLSESDKTLLKNTLVESGYFKKDETEMLKPDFTARYSDLTTNPKYIRVKETDKYGYSYQCIYDGDKLIGTVGRTNVRFYNDETSGDIYYLDGTYDCSFEQTGAEAKEGEYTEEKHFYPDGTVEVCDKDGNSVTYDREGNIIERKRTELTDDGPIEVRINQEAGLKRVLNSNVEGGVYDSNGELVYNVYSYLDANGRIELQTREYPDGRVVTFSPQHKIENLTEKEKENTVSVYLSKVKEDITNALAILKDYEAGKGVLGSTAQLFIKDEATSESKIKYYEELLSKFESLEGLSLEKFESEFKRLFGKDFNYAAMYALNKSNENLTLAANTLKSIAAIDSALELVLPAEEDSGFLGKDSLFYKSSKSSLDAILKLPEREFISKAKDREFVNRAYQALATILGEKDAREYLFSIYSIFGNEEEAKTRITSALKNIKTSLETQYSTITRGKGIEFLQQQTASAYHEAFAFERTCAEDASALVETYMQTKACLETGITVAVSVATMGTSLPASITGVCVRQFGQKAGSLAARALLASLNAAVPVALEFGDAATSEKGITAETKDVAWEKFKSGMIYGGFGTFVSGPLGNALTKYASTKGIGLLAANCIGTGLETSADVVFDRLTSDLSLQDSFLQNGGMNFAMMLLGGQVAKRVEKSQ